MITFVLGFLFGIWLSGIRNSRYYHRYVGVLCLFLFPFFVLYERMDRDEIALLWRDLWLQIRHNKPIR